MLVFYQHYAASSYQTSNLAIHCIQFGSEFARIFKGNSKWKCICSSLHSVQHLWPVPLFYVDKNQYLFFVFVLWVGGGDHHYFNNFSPVVFVLFCLFLLSSLPMPTSSPMVLSSTVRPIPLICIATGGVWAQGQALPSPSSLLHLHPPLPHPVPPVHGHVLPQLCYQTTLPTAHWAPWFLHHESRAGRFVHHLSPDDHCIPLLLVNHLSNTHLMHCLRLLNVWIHF